jgi:phosphatidate cytidylyltransferase
VLIAIAAAAAWAGGSVAGVVVAGVAGAVHAEWAGVTENGPRAALPFTIAVAVTMIVYGIGLPGAALAVAVAALLAATMAGPRPWRPVGVLYALALGLSLLVLRDSADYGVAAIAVVVGVVAATDIGAYAAGRAIGGPKLWPRVSPKKTWAGAIGGLAAGIVAGIACALLFGLPLNAAFIAVVVALAVVSQVGDLFESHVKRLFGAKDSGTLLPGHGGMMDRVDGLVFAGTLAVLIGIAHGGLADPARGLVAW